MKKLKEVGNNPHQQSLFFKLKIGQDASVDYH